MVQGFCNLQYGPVDLKSVWVVAIKVKDCADDLYIVRVLSLLLCVNV